MAEEQRPGLFVTDFDGTLTRHDFFHLVTERFAPSAFDEYWQGYRTGRYTHFEALRGIFRSIRATEAELLEVVGRAEPDPELGAWVSRLNQAGWDVVVASAGCEWYIQRVLASCGVDLEVHANPGRFAPDTGLVMEMPTGSPYRCPKVGIDKAAVVRAGLARGQLVAFAGDGNPDAAAARLVPPRRRFARGDLRAALEREGLPFRFFDRWRDVATALCAEPPPAQAPQAAPAAQPALPGGKGPEKGGGA